MNDTKNPGDTLSVAPARTLTLKRPFEAGVVRQSFSHGRSKAVVVEKVKRRAIAPGEAYAPREANMQPPLAAPRPRPQSRKRRRSGRRPELFCVR
jgi:translation initiation factor IF-2